MLKSTCFVVGAERRKEFKMPPNINWKELIKVDPDDLPRQEELADNLLVSLSKVLIK